nr:helix-turn-helix domain-containing protein [Cohaesibacter sp. CAU 1516]
MTSSWSIAPAAPVPASAAASKTITEIAFRWGFNDAAHFSRSFRRCYGEAARVFRSRYP